MSKEAKKRRRGRPPLPQSERISKPLNMRISDTFYDAAEAYRVKKNLGTMSAAVREAAEQTFRREGLL